MLTKLKKIYKDYKDRAFLKKHGCKTWEQYHREFDPDYNYRATRIKDYYHGYPHVYCFENLNHQIYYTDTSTAIRNLVTIEEWCKKNLKGKFRFDFHRVFKTNRYSDTLETEWEINEIGGGDFIFFACKDKTDYLLFLLRWS